MRLIRGSFPLVLGGALCAASATTPALAGAASDAVRAWVSAVDASPDWTASFQSVTDEGEDDVVVKGLTIKSEATGALGVAVGTLTFRGFAAAGDGFMAASVEADQAKFTAGPMIYTVEGASFANLGVPSLSGISFDPQRPFLSMVRAYTAVTRMRLESGRIAHLQLDQTNQGVASAISYQNIALGKLDGGRLEQLTAGPIAMASPAPEGLVRFSVDRMDGRGIDIDAMTRVFDPDRYVNGVGDGVWKTALNSGGYRNISVEALGLKLTIGSIAAENMKLRQPARSFAAMFDRPEADTRLTGDNSIKLVTGQGLDLLSSASFGRLALDDMDVAGTGFSRFRIGNISLEDASLDSLGEVRVDDMRVAAGDDAQFSLGRFSVGQIVMPKAEAMLGVVTAFLGDDDPDLSSVAPQVGFVDVRGMKFSAQELGEVGVENFRLDMGSYVGAVPTVVALNSSGVSLDRKFLRGFPEARLLTELGYDKINVDSALKVDWREADSALRIEDFHVAIDKVGSVKAALDFGGLTRSELMGDGGVDALKSKLTFGGGSIAITDDSAIDRVFNAQAERLKIEPAALKKRASDFIPALTKMLGNPFLRGQVVGVLPKPLAALVTALTPMLNDPALSQQVVKAVQGFIDTNGTIEVRAQPSTPVPIGALAETAGSSPEKLPALLSVQITKTP